MKLKPHTWDGHALNDGESYSALFPRGSGVLPPAAALVMAERPYNAPVLTYAGRGPVVLALIVFCEGERHAQIDQLKTWFDPTDASLKELVAVDAAGSGAWKLDCVVEQIAAVEGHAVTIRLVAPDCIWQSVDEHADSWAITASGQTHDVTPGGNKAALPTFEITPTVSKTGSGFAYKRWVPLYSNVDDPLPGYPVELSDGGFDTAALVSGGKMQADGDDLRIFVDGVEATRWLVDMNTASTLIWVVLDLEARREVTLAEAIPSSGAISTIAYEASVAISAFPPAGTLLIDDEAFTYTGIDDARGIRRFTGVTRAVKGTSTALHTAGATVRLIQHDIWLCYGNASLDAPESSDSRKPVFELDSSGNTEWAYDVFQSSESTRVAQWEAGVVRTRGTGGETDWYTADRETDADPAEEMGLRAGAYNVNGRWRGDRVELAWTFSHACGITEVASSGEYYRCGTKWPPAVGLQYAIGAGKKLKFVDQWTLASPTDDTWTAWSKPGESLGETTTTIRFVLSGSIDGGEDYKACVEAADVTLTLDADAVPTVSIREEQGGYELDCKITNNATGEWLSVHAVIDQGQTLVVDTAAKTVVYEADGSSCLSALALSSVRQQWLALLPDQDNELQFDDGGTQGVTLVTRWRDHHI